MTSTLHGGTLSGAILQQLAKLTCNKFGLGAEKLNKTRPRLYGGVVTQRIANPLPRVEKPKVFLQQTAQRGRNGARTCNKFAFGGLLLLMGVLAGCGPGGVLADPNAGAAWREGEALGRACVASRPSAHCEGMCQSEYARGRNPGVFNEADRRRGCLTGVYKGSPDPAPELAGAPQ